MLKFVGTGSAFNTELGNTSAYIKEGNTVFVIDCGETAFARMKQLNIFEDVENVYIAITHMHSDHVGSIGGLVEYLTIIKGITPTFVITNDESAEKQEENLITYLSLLGIEEDDYDFSYGDMLEDVLPGLIKVEMPKVNHSYKLTCYAIEIYFKNYTIYYTGDHNDINYLKQIRKNLKPNDIVYTDCTNKEYKGRIHVHLKELAQVFDEDVREQINCMHFDNFNTACAAKELGFKTASKEHSIEELLKQIAGRK